MSTSTAKMLRDAAGNLIPQYYDQTSDAFVPGVGNSSVRQIGSDVAFPQAWLLPWSIVSSLGTPLALPSDLTNYAMGFVTFSGLGTETILMQALIDGTVVSDAIMVQKTDGTYVAATALTNGTYRFPICFKSAQITKSAAVSTMTATFAFKANT